MIDQVDDQFFKTGHPLFMIRCRYRFQDSLYVSVRPPAHKKEKGT